MLTLADCFARSGPSCREATDIEPHEFYVVRDGDLWCVRDRFDPAVNDRYRRRKDADAKRDWLNRVEQH